MAGATRFLLVVGSPLSLILHRRSFSLYKRLSHTPFSLSPLHIRRNFNLSLQHLPINTNCSASSSQPLHTQSNSINDDHYNSYSGNNQQHPWPEWSNFIHTLSSSVAAEPQGIVSDDGFVSNEYLSREFVDDAASCLSFARNRPQLLGFLSRKDMEVVVQNGTPFLFQSAVDTCRRMRAFLGSAGTTVLETDKAQTVDLMKYILSYASNPTVSLEKTDYSVELVESSVRNLLNELAKVVNMKAGDWICPRCSFMNFARNGKCLECEEARPRRQLTGREWECPRCYFYNFGRNTMCLKCDCKRPGEPLSSPVSSSSGLRYNNGDNANKRQIDRKLADNEEKAQLWFNKVSQLGNSSDLSSAAADEDFPEIMPIRKGENRFVVSTRKTPLERRLANTQNQRSVASELPPESNDFQNAGSNLGTSFGRRLDQIITRTPNIPEADNRNISEQSKDTFRSNKPGSGSLQDGLSKSSNSGYVPFVPLPADMFAKKTESSSSEKVSAESLKSVSSETYNSQAGTVPMRNASRELAEPFQMSENLENTIENENKEKEQVDNSDGWFKRVAELHNAPDSTNAISDKDLQDIMPMRKGENKFVVSKKKDRSLTSSVYKKQMAMEQANNNSFVPFVPFPPDYFAKKNQQQADNMTVDAKKEDSGRSPEKSDNSRQGYLNLNQESSKEDQQTDSAVVSGTQISGYSSGSRALKDERWSTDACSGKDETSYTGPPSTGDTNRIVFSSHSSVIENASKKDGVSRTEGPSTSTSSQYFSNIQSSGNMAGSTTSSPEAQKFNSGWSGKSLEGSAVKETDPLDMSEEAKAERWFRRVAQIKDSSELSQIPDEDFPSIMPMRKGVNRFVVSKRKTPMERRLTSPQYRRNLPVVSSDPVKKEDDSN
ncbi:hypothetical protein ACET3Z_023472 [Daucus carota]